MAGGTSTPGIASVFAAIRATPRELHRLPGDSPQSPRPFVTISREGGAGGHSIGNRLVQRLNELDPGEPPWTLWDKALVEKVASDHHIAKELIEELGSSHKPWMQEFLSELALKGDLAEVRVYRSVAATIRTLAMHGRAVIVGRGGAFITRHMAGGVHLRLVAPIDFRVASMARQLNITREEAAERVRQLDHERESFYKRYWAKNIRAHDAFTLAINIAHVDEARAVECVLPLVLANARIVVPVPAAEVLNPGV